MELQKHSHSGHSCLRVTKHFTLRMNIWQQWSTVLSRWEERVKSQRWLLYCTVKVNARQYSTRKCKMSTLFSGHYFRNRSTLDIGVLGYIGIFQHKEHYPEVLSIPPGTSCIYPLSTDYYLFIKYLSPLHVSSFKYSSSGGYSCTNAAYGTVTLYESSW